MSYMVLECHPGYAVVIDEDGKFLKVANRKYTVGQMLTEVVQMQLPAERKRQKWLTPLLTAAACLALILGVTLPGSAQPYASVYVKINPEVRIDVDKKDRVLELEGVNQDGKDLIQGYDYHKKDLDLVTDELVDKAIDMGFLHTQGQITITFDSADEVWVQQHSESLPHQLENYLKNKLTVTIQLGELLEELDVPEVLEDAAELPEPEENVPEDQQDEDEIVFESLDDDDEFDDIDDDDEDPEDDDDGYDPNEEDDDGYAPDEEDDDGYAPDDEDNDDAYDPEDADDDEYENEDVDDDDEIEDIDDEPEEEDDAEEDDADDEERDDDEED